MRKIAITLAILNLILAFLFWFGVLQPNSLVMGFYCMLVAQNMFAAASK